MSVAYGGPGYAPYNGPTGSINFGWISEAWDVYKRSWWIWSLSALIYFAVIIAAYVPFELVMIGHMGTMPTRPLAASYLTPYSVFAGIPWYWIAGFYVAIIAINVFMSSSYLQLALKSVRREPIGFADAFGGARAMGRLFALFVIVAIVGVLLSLIPYLVPRPAMMTTAIVCMIGSLAFSIVIYPLLIPAPAMAVDGVSPMTAIVRSASAMAPKFFIALLFLFATSLLLGLATLFTCYLGGLVTLPMAYIICVLAYRDMVGMTGIIEPTYGYGYPQYAPQPQGVWPPPPSDLPPSHPTYGGAGFAPPQPPYPTPNPAPPTLEGRSGEWAKPPEPPSADTFEGERERPNET